MAARRNYVPATAITMFLLMLLMSMSSAISSNELTVNESQQAEGRQGSDGLTDVDCSGYTFEDLFDYNFALFNIDIEEDWARQDFPSLSYLLHANLFA